MTFLTHGVLGLLSGVGLLSKVLGGGHKKKPPLQPTGPATRDEAKSIADAEDELRRRRGSAADMLTGMQGAEAAAGSVGRLVASN